MIHKDSSKYSFVTLIYKGLFCSASITLFQVTVLWYSVSSTVQVNIRHREVKEVTRAHPRRKKS